MSLEKSEGAGNAGCPRHPQPVCIDSKHTVVTTSTPDHPAFPAQWFYGLCRALLGDEFVFVTVASRIDGGPNPVGPTSPPQGLASATDARTTRFCRTQRPPPKFSTDHVLPASSGEDVEAPFVLRAARSLTENRPAITSRARRCRVHRILPRVRDDRDTPLSWGGRREFLEMIWGEGKEEYFPQAGLTGRLQSRPGRRSRMSRRQADRQPGRSRRSAKAVRRQLHLGQSSTALKGQPESSGAPRHVRVHQ